MMKGKYEEEMNGSDMPGMMAQMMDKMVRMEKMMEMMIQELKINMGLGDSGKENLGKRMSGKPMM